MNERDEAVAIAERVLRDYRNDPDSDAAVVARLLLQSVEREKLLADCLAMHDITQ